MVMELAKIEAFELWIRKHPEIEEQVSAQTLLHRLTAKFNQTFKNLRKQLYQVTTKWDDLQTINE